MKLLGLMITKNDADVFPEWCRDQVRLYDAVVCLDGSTNDDTRRISKEFPNLVYLHERDFAIPHKTDHGLRRVVHNEICSRFGFDNWIMCCHADEFCYHDPRRVLVLAETEGADCVWWYNVHFVPHPDDPDIAGASLTERCLHYHWSRNGNGIPWREHRLYRNSSGIRWDESTHGSTQPHGLFRAASFHPAIRHYKVCSLDPNRFETISGSGHYKDRWQGLIHRSGVPWPVACAEDLRVRLYPGYDRCDRFVGSFDQPWNIGDQFRPSDREV